jgi:hypothetical protein
MASTISMPHVLPCYLKNELWTLVWSKLLVLENSRWYALHGTSWPVMTTAYAIRHPWFNMSSSKRKLPPSPSSSENEEYDQGDWRSMTGPYPKRRRCSTLERGFAHLAINQPVSQTATYASSYPSPTSSNPSVLDLEPVDVPVVISPSPEPMDLEDTYPVVIQPDSIEEPTSPDFPGLPLSENGPHDIKMKSQSWYEPEKDRMSIFYTFDVYSLLIVQSRNNYNRPWWLRRRGWLSAVLWRSGR